jgi:hypothetical protein
MAALLAATELVALAEQAEAAAQPMAAASEQAEQELQDKATLALTEAPLPSPSATKTAIGAIQSVLPSFMAAAAVELEGLPME